MGDSTDSSAIRITDGSPQGSTCGAVTSLDIANDGVSFASGSKDRCVKLWHYDEGEVIATGKGHSGDINKVRISPDQKWIVSVGQEGAILVWSMADVPNEGEDYDHNE